MMRHVVHHARADTFRPEMTGAYRVVVASTTAFLQRWCRLDVTGAEYMPTSGPTLLVANHDSYWDPIAIAVAARHRRQVRALAKSSIWKTKPVAMMMDGMGHIPVERGKGDTVAMDTAIDALAAGACIGIFPEGTRSLGKQLRARSGVGRLITAVPEATIVCCRVTGTTDVVRLPKRPRVTVEFFPPAGGPLRAGETAAQVSERLLAEVREQSPPAIPGRSRTAAKFRAKVG